MTLQGTTAATATLIRPSLWGIGRYAVGDRTVTFPIERGDLERDIAWATGVLDGFGVRRGRRVHIVSGGWESPWYAPFFAATQRLGATYTCADIFGFDARRTDLFLRRLTPHVLLGLSAEVASGLIEGDLLDNLRPVPHVFARPDAAKLLQAAGLDCGVCTPIGPAFALRSVGQGDFAYDAGEWRITTRNGELLISAEASRACRLADTATGVAGVVNDHGRLVLT